MYGKKNYNRNFGVFLLLYGVLRILIALDEKLK